MCATSVESNWPWMYSSAAEAASPASFQPLKAQTITGLRKSGRSLQTTSGTRHSYPAAAFRTPGAVRAAGQDGVMPAVAESRPTVAELRAGGEVEGVFACSRKDRLVARNGSPYLAVELRDRSGSIPARAF